ncbi:hypothetical protein K438DRAFT_1808629 [Mycena galopus ATCC 62051]|nr:hypothetical protein K438DRAFT_1808629 [Mycena galopus ATCC 62051]
MGGDTSLCSKCGTPATSPFRETFKQPAPGTRHYTLLNTNEPPKDSDATLVRTLISDVDAQLTSLDDELSQVREKLRQLEHERTLLSSYRTMNKAILSPLRWMPSELLAEIFACTLPPVEDVSMWEGRRFDIARSPWLLTHVSSRWRAVAHSTPSLWSQIVIDCRTYPVPLVEVHIQRAHSIKIYFYADADSHRTVQLFRLLLQHSSRWEELSLRWTDAIVSLLTAHRGQFSSLKRLWIKSSLEYSDASSLDCFQFAPLVDVGFVNKIFFPPITLPAQITRLHLEGHSWERNTDILKLLPNLVEALLQFQTHEEFPLQVNEIIDLPCLRRLYVSRPESLHYFKSPALEELAMWPEQYDTDLLPVLESLLDRSACPLRRLCLGGFPEADMTTGIVHKLTTITELIIVAGGHAFDALMTAFAASTLAGGAVVAPQLRVLFLGSLQVRTTSNRNNETYLEMLHARWKAEGSALTNTALVRHNGADGATLRDLDALRLEGLDTRVVEGEEAINEILSWLYLSPHAKSVNDC